MNKKVTIYTWSTCPFCVKAKRLLDAKGIGYTEIEISGQRDKLQELKAKTKSGTVPQIFIDEKFIGGCDDLYALDRTGELEDLLA